MTKNAQIHLFMCRDDYECLGTADMKTLKEQTHFFYHDSVTYIDRKGMTLFK